MASCIGGGRVETKVEIQQSTEEEFVGDEKLSAFDARRASAHDLRRRERVNRAARDDPGRSGLGGGGGGTESVIRVILPQMVRRITMPIRVRRKSMAVAATMMKGRRGQMICRSKFTTRLWTMPLSPLPPGAEKRLM